MKTLKTLFPIALLLSMISLVASTTNPGTFRSPTVYMVAKSAKAYWTAGTINNGGHAVAVTAGSTATAASLTDCTYPNFGACDILYANSSGTVAVTATIGTANASGNTILAYIETDGSGYPTSIVLPLQSGSGWTNTSRSGNTAASGQYCGSTGTCSHSAIGTVLVVQGYGTLNTGSPSTLAVTGMSPAFTNTTSYTCTAQDTTTIAVNIGVLTAGYVSGSAVTFTGPNSNTDTFRYTCIGY